MTKRKTDYLFKLIYTETGLSHQSDNSSVPHSMTLINGGYRQV